MHTDPPFYFEATGQLHYEIEYKRIGILTVNGLKLVRLQRKAFPKQSKCVRFDYLQFLSSLLCQFSFASSVFFILT